jgi:hypothetical protein
MTDLTVKFDGGRMAVLGPDNRILGHIGEWLHHHDERIKEQAWEEGARAMTGSHAAQIMRIIEDAMRAANPYTPANKKDAPADEPDHDTVPLSDRRETAWRIRHPDVARSPLYDSGWQDALMNLGEFMLGLRTIHARIKGTDSHGKTYYVCKTCRSPRYDEPHDWPCPTGSLLEETGKMR